MSETKPWKRRTKMAGFWGLLLAMLIAVDQCGNVLVLGGDPDMSISTSCGLRIKAADTSLRTRFFCVPVCRMLNLVDIGHCADAKE